MSDNPAQPPDDYQGSTDKTPTVGRTRQHSQLASGPGTTWGETSVLP